MMDITDEDMEEARKTLVSHDWRENSSEGSRSYTDAEGIKHGYMTQYLPESYRFHTTKRFILTTLPPAVADTHPGATPVMAAILAAPECL